jgi:hypothetical protein
MAITLELSENKWRPIADLPQIWEENRDALVGYALTAALGGEGACVCMCMWVCVCVRERERESVCAYVHGRAVRVQVQSVGARGHTWEAKRRSADNCHVARRGNEVAW